MSPERCRREAAFVKPVDVLGDGDLKVAARLRAAGGCTSGLRMRSALNSKLNASALALSYVALEPDRDDGRSLR